MNNMEKLKEMIEFVRHRLNYAIEDNRDGDTILDISQQLDLLINDYQQILMQRN